MRALFDLFLEICLFRKGPQHIPASRALLQMCLVAYALSSLLILLLNTPLSVALLQIFLNLVLLSGLLYLGLMAYHHPQRFEQTLSALIGSDTLMGLLASPLLLWIANETQGSDVTLPSLLLFILMVWSIAIMAHILRHAFDVSVWQGALYALSYTFLSWTLIGWISPQTP